MMNSRVEEYSEMEIMKSFACRLFRLDELSENRTREVEEIYNEARSLWRAR